MKKSIVLILAMVLTLTTVIYGATNSFSDVRETDWYCSALEEVANKKIIIGYPDNTFRPENNISRAEFTKTIRVAFDLEVVEGNTFVDTLSHWAKDEITTAVENSIIDKSDYGYTFEPDKNITRMEMAEMVVRALGLDTDAKAKAGEVTTFKDDDSIDSDDKGYVMLASEKGVINGYTDGTFKPNGNATRAEAAQMLVNALEYVRQEKVKDAKTEEGYVDTSKLQKETFEDQGLTEEIRDTLAAINRSTKEIMYQPDEIIEVDKSMLPIKYEGLIIEDYYHLGYDDSILPNVYSLYWGLGGRYDMFIIEGKTTEKIKGINYSAAFLDENNEIVEEMRNVIPCENFSASDEGTQIVVNAYPNMPNTEGIVEANKDFTFIFLKMEKNFSQAKTVTLRYKGNGTGDVLIFPME